MKEKYRQMLPAANPCNVAETWIEKIMEIENELIGHINQLEPMCDSWYSMMRSLNVVLLQKYFGEQAEIGNNSDYAEAIVVLRDVGGYIFNYQNNYIDLINEICPHEDDTLAFNTEVKYRAFMSRFDFSNNMDAAFGEAIHINVFVEMEINHILQIYKECKNASSCTGTIKEERVDVCDTVSIEQQDRTNLISKLFDTYYFSTTVALKLNSKDETKEEFVKKVFNMKPTIVSYLDETLQNDMTESDFLTALREYLQQWFVMPVQDQPTTKQWFGGDNIPNVIRKQAEKYKCRDKNDKIKSAPRSPFASGKGMYRTQDPDHQE